MTVRGEYPFYEVIDVPNPAAGVNWIHTVSGSGQERVVSAAFTLVTDATAVTRGVTIEVDDGTTRVYAAGASFTQAASTTQTYGITTSGSDYGAAATVCHIPLPAEGYLLFPGWRLITSIRNLQAGDQLSGIGLLIEKLPNGPTLEYEGIHLHPAHERRI